MVRANLPGLVKGFWVFPTRACRAAPWSDARRQCCLFHHPWAECPSPALQHKAKLNPPGFVFPFHCWGQLCLCKSLGMTAVGCIHLHAAITAAITTAMVHGDLACILQQPVTVGMVETGKVKDPLGAIREMMPRLEEDPSALATVPI